MSEQLWAVRLEGGDWRRWAGGTLPLYADRGIAAGIIDAMDLGGSEVVAVLLLPTAELDALRAEVERLRADKERLDWLDGMNRALNGRYGTQYGWRLVTNHNVNRLFLGHMVVDLHDSEGGAAKQPSCRDAIDAHRRSLARGEP